MFDALLMHFCRILVVADTFSESTFWTILSFTMFNVSEPPEMGRKTALGIFLRLFFALKIILIF